MDVVWRRQAERDLKYIFDFVLEHDSDAAEKLCDRIERRVRQPRDHPYMGRPGRVAGTRELIVASTPYIVAYSVAASQVDVLAVIHAARRWPPALD
jgi:addiction module RelE/StbE family toxin